MSRKSNIKSHAPRKLPMSTMNKETSNRTYSPSMNPSVLAIKQKQLRIKNIKALMVFTCFSLP